MAGYGRCAAALLLIGLVCFTGTSAVSAAAPDKELAGSSSSRELKALSMELDAMSMDAAGSELQLALSSSPARRLLGAAAAQQLWKPQCGWDAGKCWPLQDNWLQFKGTPSSPYRRAWMMAYDRYDHCGAYKSKQACIVDQANRCVWRAKSNTCMAMDFLDLDYYMSKDFRAGVWTVPPSMTCPGSRAQEILTCMSRLDGDCTQAPSCFMGKVADTPTCLPKSLKDWTSQQFMQFAAGIAAADPQLLGNCEAACWVRQAKKCSDIKSGEAACNSVPYCVYSDKSSTCRRMALEFNHSNSYEEKVGTLYSMCLGSENQRDCEAYKGAKAQNDIAWKNYKQPTAAVQCKL